MIIFLLILLLTPSLAHAEDVIISPPLEASPVEISPLKIVPVNADDVILPADLGDIDHYVVPVNKDLMLVGYPSLVKSQERLSPNGAFNDKLELRTPNSMTWDYLDGTIATKIFQAPQWIKQKGEWYDIVYSIVPDVQYIKAKEKLGFFRQFLQPVYSASFTTGTSYDWQMGRTGVVESWNATVTGNGTANFSGPGLAGTYAYAEQNGGTGNGIFRASLPFDTSAIPSNAILQTGKLGLGCTNKYDTDGNGQINVFQHTIANITAPGSASYQNSMTNTTTGASAITVASFNCASWVELTLNATGLSWIKRAADVAVCNGGTLGLSCLAVKVNNDYTNTSPSAGATEGVKIAASNSTHPPYLTITYTLPSTSTPATTTGYTLADFTNTYYDVLIKIGGAFLFFGLMVGIFDVIKFVKKNTAQRL